MSLTDAGIAKIQERSGRRKMTTNDRLAEIQRWWAGPDIGVYDKIEWLIRRVEALKRELHAKAVCDCHMWPTIKEFHAYVCAVEKERDILRATFTISAEEALELYESAYERHVEEKDDATYHRMAMRDFLTALWRRTGLPGELPGRTTP